MEAERIGRTNEPHSSAGFQLVDLGHRRVARPHRFGRPLEWASRQIIALPSFKRIRYRQTAATSSPIRWLTWPPAKVRSSMLPIRRRMQPTPRASVSPPIASGWCGCRRLPPGNHAIVFHRQGDVPARLPRFCWGSRGTSSLANRVTWQPHPARSPSGFSMLKEIQIGDPTAKGIPCQRRNGTNLWTWRVY